MSDLSLIVLENRGLGGSDLGQEPFELADLADDAVHLLDHLGLEKACIWGVSMGGMIAQEFALRHPQRCAGLILGCTWCGGAESIYMAPEVLETMARVAQNGHHADSLREALPLNFSPKVWATLGEEYVTLRGAHLPPLETWNRQREATSRFDASLRLAGYEGPALLLHGGADAVVPSANLEVLHQKLPQAQVHRWPEARHLFWIEEAPEVNARVSDFVRQCWA
jgi:pimeloyl-ACP methyl ester carboxylesterase